MNAEYIIILVAGLLILLVVVYLVLRNQKAENKPEEKLNQDMGSPQKENEKLSSV